MPENDAHRRYVRSECVTFRKTNEEFGALSNMAPGFPLIVNGVHIRSCEALYQACRFPFYPELQERIINQKSPMTAKMVSRPHIGKTRDDWHRENIRIMQWCLRVKLLQNYPSFSRVLLLSGNKPIVEDSRKDDFWGAKPTPDGELVGSNVLGRLLMELRENVKEFALTPPKQLLPPRIDNFLLFGQQITSIKLDLSQDFQAVQAKLS